MPRWFRPLVLMPLLRIPPGRGTTMASVKSGSHSRDLIWLPFGSHHRCLAISADTLARLLQRPQSATPLLLSMSSSGRGAAGL
jgi:hypothetical protein